MHFFALPCLGKSPRAQPDAPTSNPEEPKKSRPAKTTAPREVKPATVSAVSEPPAHPVAEFVIQLASKTLKDKFPDNVEGIKVNAKCQRLRILHATSSPAPDDTVVAKYTVHYQVQPAETIEIVYGKDVRDWWRHNGDNEPTPGNVSWKGTNAAAKAGKTQTPSLSPRKKP